jgi:hypothetical protein
MDYEMKILWMFFFGALIFVAILVAMGISKTQEKSKMAAENGCQYLGPPRDLIGVDFYDCKGEIIMRRRGSKL